MIPLLVATLEGDVAPVDRVDTLGASWIRKAGRAVASRGKVVGHSVARVGRATGRVGMQISRGNVRGALVDTGRLVTTVVTAPATTAVGLVSAKAGRQVEGVIRRNDPAALVSRKIFDAVVSSVRPIVDKFGDEVEPFGAETGARRAAALKAARSRIIAAALPAGTAAGTAVGGPPGGAAGAAMVPSAVDAVIREIAKRAGLASSNTSMTMTPEETATVPAPEATGSGKRLVIIGAAALGAFLLLRRS